MIEVFENQLKQESRHSSKGNQLKWEKDGIWYKADYTGYEGLAEYVVSRLLEYSSLSEEEFLKYELEEMRYRTQIYRGVRSKNMLTDDWQIITLERLFKSQYNQSLYTTLWGISGTKERLEFLCRQVERITGLNSFGVYMAKLLTIDAIFKNEDRHTHNIAILMNSIGEYKLCPIFDHGAALLADTKMDYPMDADVYEMLEDVQAKTVSFDFDQQLEAAEELYGQPIRFTFKKQDVDHILQEIKIYNEKEIERVRCIIYQQMRKYLYLFV